MIKKIDETKTKVTTDGCDCCSIIYNPILHREKIIKELKENIEVASKVCEAMQIPFNEFIDKTLAEGNSGH